MENTMIDTGNVIIDNWDFLRKKMYPNWEEDVIKPSRLKDITVTPSVNSKSIKKRPKKLRRLQIGDTITNHGIGGKVIDIDCDTGLICVEVLVNNNVEIWNIDDIKKENQIDII